MAAPGFVAPMLARPGPLPRGDRWWAEVKWDGVRIVGRVVDGRLDLWARSGITRTAAWPEFAGLVDALDGRPAVLDGEAVVFSERRPRFDLVQRRMHVSDPRVAARLAEELPATWMLFDLLGLDGVDLFDRPLEERRALLEDLVTAGPSWRVSPIHEDPAALLDAVAEQAMEGIVVKRPTSTYRPGRRSDAWVKVKATCEDDFVVGGWLPGSGHRSPTFGSLALGVAVDDDAPTRLRYVGSVGSGFSDSDLDRLRAAFDSIAATRSPFVVGTPPATLHPVEPVVRVRVRYGEWTPDGLLRHPVMVGVVT